MTEPISLAHTHVRRVRHGLGSFCYCVSFHYRRSKTPLLWNETYATKLRGWKRSWRQWSTTCAKSEKRKKSLSSNLVTSVTHKRDIKERDGFGKQKNNNPSFEETKKVYRDIDPGLHLCFNHIWTAFSLIKMSLGHQPTIINLLHSKEGVRIACTNMIIITTFVSLHSENYKRGLVTLFH